MPAVFLLCLEQEPCGSGARHTTLRHKVAFMSRKDHSIQKHIAKKIEYIYIYIFIYVCVYFIFIFQIFIFENIPL